MRYLVQADFSFLRQRCSPVAPTDILPYCKQQGCSPPRHISGLEQITGSRHDQNTPLEHLAFSPERRWAPTGSPVQPQGPLPPRGLVLAALLLVAVPALPVSVLPLPAAVPAAPIVPLKVVAALPAVVAVPLVLAGNRVGSEAWMWCSWAPQPGDVLTGLKNPSPSKFVTPCYQQAEVLVVLLKARAALLQINGNVLLWSFCLPRC